MYTLNGNAMFLDNNGNMIMHSLRSKVNRVKDHKYISKEYKNGKWYYKYERPVTSHAKVRATVSSRKTGEYVDSGNYSSLPEFKTYEDIYAEQEKANKRKEKSEKIGKVITTVTDIAKDPREALLFYALQKLGVFDESGNLKKKKK